MTIREAHHIFTHQSDYDKLTVAAAIDVLGDAGMFRSD